jgi:hypothetical protein
MVDGFSALLAHATPVHHYNVPLPKVSQSQKYPLMLLSKQRKPLSEGPCFSKCSSKEKKIPREGKAHDKRDLTSNVRLLERSKKFYPHHLDSS